MIPTNIDIHHHMLPDFYLRALSNRGVDTSSLPEWSPEQSLALMDSLGIQKALLSVPSPGAWDADMAHKLNAYSAKLTNEHPERFGALAALPFPDVDSSVLEIRYALDELGLDGVILFSNVDGCYLGDPEYDDILAELDKRSALVLVHANDRPGIGDNDAFNAFVEYPTDVARAYARLMLSHAFTRFPRIHFVFAHAGGVVPFLAGRIGKLHYMNGKKPRWGRIMIDLATKKNGGLDLSKTVSYEVADSCSRFTLRGLTELVDPSKILFGSNYPFSPEAMISASIKTLREFEV